MADSPLKQKVDLVSIDVVLNGTTISSEYSIIEVEVKKEVNRIPTATVVLLDGDPAQVNFEKSEKSEFEPGAEIQINAGYHRQNKTIFKGVVLSQNTRVKSDDMSELVVKAVDKAASMTVQRKNRYFPEATDTDVITKVLGDHSVDKSVGSASFKHEGMVQFDATDWDFMLTRAEVNGFVVTVDDGKVTVDKPDVSSSPVISLTYGTDILKMDLDLDARSQVKSVTAEGWDMASNKIVSATAKEPAEPGQGNLDGSKLAGVLGGAELKLHSSGPIEKDMLQSWADAKLMRARLARVRGKLRFQGHADVKPNTVIEINGAGTRFNGNAYVSGVYHKIKEYDWDTEATIGLTPHSFTETQRDIQTPPGGGMLPAIHGLQIGKVQKIDEDPQGETRILCDVPVITESGDGVWARQTTYYATKEAGNFFIPEVGDEVILGFINDDPRYPVIIGSVYSKSQMPAYTPDADNTYKAIVTNSKMKIEFEDIKRIITIWTPNKNYIEINDEKGTITIEDENKNKMVMSNKGFDFKTPYDFVVKADGNINMEATKAVAIKATEALTMEGMSVESKASTSNTMKGATAEVNGSGQTTVKGGIVMIN